METTFRELCEQHGLCNIGTMFQPTFGNFLTVYLHWGESGCVSGGGVTFDAALANALTAMAEAKAAEADAPQLIDAVRKEG